MFKVGSKVRCINKVNPDSDIIVGITYIIGALDPDDAGILGIEEVSGFWTVEQFELVNKINPQEIYKKGY